MQPSRPGAASGDYLPCVVAPPPCVRVAACSLTGFFAISTKVALQVMIVPVFACARALYVSGKRQVHTFEDIDMQPPIPASEVDKPTAMIIAEMLRLRGDLERILAAPPRGGDSRHMCLCRHRRHRRQCCCCCCCCWFRRLQNVLRGILEHFCVLADRFCGALFCLFMLA